MKVFRFKTFWFYHLLGYFFGVLILIYPFLFPNEGTGWDPYWPRVILGGFLFAFILSSFFSSAIRKNYWPLIIIFAAAATVWLTILVFTNEIRPDYAFFQLLSILMTAVILQDLKLFWAFAATIFAVSLSLVWVPENPKFPPFAIIIAELFSVFGVGLIKHTQQLERNYRAKRKQKAEARAKELLVLESEILVEMSKSVGVSEQKLDEAIGKMAYDSIQNLNANEISVWLLYKKGTEIECTHEVAHKGKQGLKGRRFRAGQLEKFIDRVNQVRVASAWSPIEIHAKQEWESLIPGFIKSHCLWVPMRLSGRLKGFFIIQDPGRKNDWTHAEMRFVGALGDIGSMLMEGSKRQRIQEELRERNFELDSFVYRASHDLKAPLNSLMGLLSLVNAKGVEGDMKNYVDMMEKSVVKLNTFIHNLSEFSRVQRMELKQEKIDFQGMLDEIFEGLKYMEGNDRLEKTFVQTGDGMVYGDKFHLEIILANLISNTIKYQDYEKENPFVKVEVDIKPAGTVIKIIDNGIGIPEKFKDKMFGLFFRASNQAFGSGLGLYIIQNAAKKMGGNITFESEEGIGSTFTVNLPNKALPEQQEEATKIQSTN